MSNLPSDQYILYFDNFFTSLPLLEQLAAKNIHATGKVGVNRIDKCPVTVVDVIKKQAHGTFDFKQDTTSGIVITRWNNNSVVTLASNCPGVQPAGVAKRWSRAERKCVDVPQPFVVSQYNRYMGGVDRMHQNTAAYNITIRSRKWWWALFAYLLDVAMQYLANLSTNCCCSSAPIGPVAAPP